MNYQSDNSGNTIGAMYGGIVVYFAPTIIIHTAPYSHIKKSQ